jgi:hypothetical protein
MRLLKAVAPGDVVMMTRIDRGRRLIKGRRTE